MGTRRLAGITGVIVLVALLAVVIDVAGAAAAAPAPRRVGNRPAIPPGAQAVGTLGQQTRISATVALKPRDPAALEDYALAVSTPSSAVYHHYLSVAEFARRFGATAQQLATARAALRARGLTVGEIAPNGLSFALSGTAASFARGFSTSFERYRLRNGRTGYANSSAPLVSAPAATVIRSVIGLDTLSVRKPLAVRGAASRGSSPAPRATASVSGPSPCTGAAGAASANGAYTASQIASAYGLSGLYGGGDLGGGVSVALYELEPYAPSDIGAYQSCYRTSTSVANVIVDGGAGTGAGQGEAALDIEDVLGLAPQANVLVYEGPNRGTGPYDTYSRLVTDNRAQVISTSWGLCEPILGAANAAAENDLFQEAAVQGQSVFAAAGDAGADDCADGRGPAVDDPASQPFVTGVGGTALSSVGPPPSETVWNSNGATGGGASTLWGRPSYQSAVAVNQSAINCGASNHVCREVPDVSADADLNTGYVVYWGGGWHPIGGTSAAAPTWAALTALANASSACTGTQVGFANVALYQAQSTAYSSDFNDVTSGNNSYDGIAGYSAAHGYDMASGLGTPIGSALASTICGNSSDSVTFAATPATQRSRVGIAITPLTVRATSSAGHPVTYSASNLPPGIALNSATGALTGTPTTAGTFSVMISGVDSQSRVGKTSLVWVVAPRAVVTIISPGAQTGRVGVSQRLQISARDSAGFPLHYSASGLPAGLSINAATGVVSGTPTSAARSTSVVTASDSGGSFSWAVFSWTVAGPPSVASASLRMPRSGPRLSLKFSAGSYAPAIKAVAVGATSSIHLSSRRRSLTKGVGAFAPGGSRLKFSSRIASRALMVTLQRGAGTVALAVSAPELSLGATLSRSIAHRHPYTVTLPVKVTDAGGAVTALSVRIRVP